MSDAQADSVTSYLLPWIDGRYRTKPDRAHRALGGISRGGRLALLTAAANPDTFCAVGGHSPAVRSTDATRDLADAVARHPDAYRLDVGATDALRTGVERFADRLGTLGSPTAVAVADGGHDRQYWRAHTADYLTFYSAKLSD